MTAADGAPPLDELAERLERVAHRLAEPGLDAPELRRLADEAVALSGRIGEALPAALRDDEGSG